MKERTYIAIDLKSFYASVECVERDLDPLEVNLVVADVTRTEKTICLAVSPVLKSYGIPGRARLFEVVQKVAEVNEARRYRSPGGKFQGSSSDQRELRKHPELALDYVTAPPRMALYMEYSRRIYAIYLKYIAPEDIHVYSIDEVFLDVTSYLKTYGLTSEELARKMIREVLHETGITATAGIGTNLYLAKIAMDIVAKHIEDHIGMLDEISYREQLWGHKPLSDFWRIGSRTEKKLAGYGIQTMGDIALASIQSEDWLYKMFGIDAELLVDHAWGCESCKMSDIKNYHTEEHSLTNGQVLMRNYTFEEAAVVVREMTDVLVLDLVEKGLVTNSVTLWIAYDHRFEREPSKGTVRFPDRTNRSKEMIDTVEALYRKIADPHTGIRRIEIIANKITLEGYQQYTLFQDSIKAEKERHLQEAVLQVKKRYGKNAIMRGSNLLECSTYRERNNQVGGHRA